MSWLAQQTAALDAAHSATGLAVNWLIQSTLLIAAGLAAGRLLQHRGSAVQSAVYRMTLFAVAVCPLASLVLSLWGFSGWSLAMPSAYKLAVAENAEPVVLAPSAVEPLAPTAAESQTWINGQFQMELAVMAQVPPAEPPARFDDVTAPSVTASAQLQSNVQTATEANAAVQPIAVPGASAAEQLDVERFGVFAVVSGILWALAAAVLWARLLVAWRRLGRIRRGASPAATSTMDICRELARQMQIGPPAVLHSPYLPSPCLAGVLRPAIMLPDEDSEPQAQPVRDVLVHELAHLRRHDCHWNLLRRATTALLWFQPLLWVLSRRLEASAEEVCDDYVVQLGGDRQRYAHRLVDLAELSATPFGLAGVAMVSIRSMLERRVKRVMDTSRSLSTRVGNVLLVLLLVGGGLGTLAAGLVGLNAKASATTDDNGSQDLENASSATSRESGEPEEAQPPAADSDLVNVHGVVLDPKGEPVPGAEVCVLRWYWNFGDRKPLATTKADAQGRFEISYRKSQFAETAGRPQQWRETYIASFVDGFGPGWAHYDRLKSGEEARIQLAADDVPLEGRVIDLEGNPVAGAVIEVGSISEPKADTLDEYISAIKAGQATSTAFATIDESLPHHSMNRWPNIVTDAEGRFRISEVGRERLVELHISGPTIVTKSIRVATRRLKPIVHPAYSYEDSDDATQYGSQFEYVAAPSRPIEGVIRDADTGEPIAGAEVWSWKFAGQDISGITTIKTKSDDNGRYRLDGMPKGDGNEVVIVPTDLPYFTAEFEVPNPSGTGPTPLDLKLHRGVWVTGRVTDKTSGKPVSAHIHYIAFPDNQLAHSLKEFKYGRHGMSVQDRFRTDAEGRYRVVALPGHGIIGVKSVLEPYPGGQGYHDIKGIEDRDSFMKLNGVFAPIEKFPTAVKEIDVAQDAENVVDFALDSGDRVGLRVVDPSGEPLTGVRVTGISEMNSRVEPTASPEFDLIAFRPGENRTVLLHHPERGLGKALRIRAEGAASDPLTVTLLPLGVLTGQLLQDGEPVAGASLRIDVAGDNDYGRNLPGAATDAEGRFRHEEILPGLKYTVNVEGAGIRFATVAKELAIEPGETVDLGSIDIAVDERPEPTRSGSAVTKEVPTPKTSKRSQNEDRPEYAGSVVTPDGKPAAEADVYLIYYLPEPTGLLTPSWQPVAKSDAEGRFRFELDSSSREHASLVAVKEGYGFAWSEAAFHETSGRLLNELKAKASDAVGVFSEQYAARLKRAGQPLQLVADEQPIQGRIVDINGQPVANASLTLVEVSASLDGDLSAWRAAAKADKADYYSARVATPLMMNGPQVRSIVEPATTDADGRFTLRGVGRGRIAELLVEGPGIETAKVLARTEAGEAIELERERRAPHGKYTYHPEEFTHVAGPSIPIVGVVRDAKTKAPLEGVTVKSQSRHGEQISGWGQDFVRAVTNSEGRYQLHGMPIGEDNRIAAIAPDDEPYLSMSHKAATSAKQNAAGLDSLEINFDFQRGMWIEGRVSDKQTGEGLSGRLEYHVHKDNPNYQLTRNMNVDERDRLRADKEGRFRIVALSGRGYVAFSAEAHERYGRATSIILADGSRQPADEYLMQTGPSLLMPANYHVVAEINPAKNEERHELKLELDSGSTVTGRVVDADGKPVSGFYFSGRIVQFQSWRPGKGDSFDVTGYDLQTPREVYIAHPARNLAGHVRLSGEPPKDLTVKLRSAGTIKGRLVDNSGAPIANYALVRWSSPIASPADFNRIRRGPPLPPSDEHTQVGEHETDDEGRFEISCLVPGIEYRISAFDRQSMKPSPARTPGPSGPLDRVIVVESGQTLDLGDVGIADRDDFAQAQKKQDVSDQAPPAAAAAAQPKPAPTATEIDAKQNEPAPAKPVTGRVVDADGKPVAGAKLHWITWTLRGPQPEPTLVGATEDSGAFSFIQPDWRSESGETGARSPNDQLIVTAPHHGMRVLMPNELEATKTSVLRTIAQALGAGERKAFSIQLPKPAPIRGRIIDVDGQPVAGARVTLRKLSRDQDHEVTFSKQSLQARGETENLDLWARALSMERYFYPQRLAEVAPSAASDADGRFELDGIGEDAIVELLVQGEGIESELILVHTAPAEAITLKADGNFQLEDRTLHGLELTHVAGPSKPVTGRVLDYDTGQPIAGAVVRTYVVHGERISSSRDRQHLATVTDGEGRYRIAGLPVGDENRLIAFTGGDEPYVPIGAVADTSVDGPALALDFRLKHGVWAVGKAYDATTKAPLTGELTYYIFPDPKLKQELPGLRHAFLDEHYFTAADGSFRVPVLASRGVLAFRYAPAGMADVTQYPRGVGAAAIEGQKDDGLSMFETWPHYLVPSNYQLVKEVSPAEGEKLINVDLPLATGRRLTVRPVDENGKPLTGIEFYGRTDSYGWEKTTAAECEVTNVVPGEIRKVVFFDRKRNLAGAAVVDENTADGLEVKLLPAALLTGRLVDEDGLKITDATLQPDLEEFRSGEQTAIWPIDPNAATNMDDARAEDGEFRIVGIVPGWRYSSWATAPRKMNGQMMDIGIGRAFDDITLEPGEERDLGDLVVSYDKPGAKAEAGAKRAGSIEKKTGANDRSSANKAASLRVHGQIRGSSGEPLPGVHVAVVSMHVGVQRGGDLKPRGAALFESTTDKNGRYTLQLSGVSPATHRYTSLIVRTEGLALAWKQLDLTSKEVEASLDLQPEQPLTIQLVDIEGQGAAGVRVHAVGVMPTIVDERPPTDGAGFQDTEQAPEAWFQPMTADEQGRLTIHNLAANHGVMLKIEGDDRFAPQDLALNSGMAEQRGERDGTYRSQVVNNVKPGEQPSIPLSPAQLFTGIVRYEDTGEPAPHARLTVWASQQEQFGSMMSVAGVADAEGRYRISPQPGIRFGVAAYPPDGAPYMGREAEPVRWDAGDESKQVDVTLPRGALVQGRVVDADSDSPIAGASIQFIAEDATSKLVPEGAITGWQNRQLSDDEGRFNIVVPPGPGRLLVHGPRNEFVIVETSDRELSSGRPGGQRYYAHGLERIELATGAEPLEVTLRLKPAASVAGTLVDPDGKPIESALMITRLAIHPNWLDWHAHASPEVTGGRFELSGLAPGEEYNVLFLDQKRKLGAVATLRAGMENPRIVLQPCGKATMRFVDPDGQPVRDVNPTVQLVVTPGLYQFDTQARARGELAADADFIANVDRLNHPGNEQTDADGRLEIDALIPGATYRVVHGASGDEFQTTDFVARSGETVDAGELLVDVDNN